MQLLTLKSVLAATDLEEGSVPALKTAARLARLAGAELHLLHVVGTPGSDGAARLRRHLDRLTPDSPEPTSVQVLPGDPTGVIVQQAVRLEADAVIVGPHRQRTGELGEMGSTAANVVRTAPCPCLVAATELRLPLERILVPIDTSAIASGTLAVALSWASALRPRWARTRLTALHVAPDPATATTAREVSEEVERARAKTRGAAGVEIEVRIAPGRDAAETILQEAASARADLVVIGTRGQTPTPPALGSVSAAVARRTPSPLLLVPPGITGMLGAES